MSQAFLLLTTRQPTEPHHGLELQNILLPRLTLILTPKLLRQLLAPLHVFRRNKVDGDLDAVADITNLERTN